MRTRGSAVCSPRGPTSRMTTAWGSLVPPMPIAVTTSLSVTTEGKETRKMARAPHISKGADHRLSKIQTLVHKTDISPRDRCIFNLITSLTGINRVEEVREVFGCSSLQTSLQGSKHSPTLHCWQNVIYIYLCVCEGWGAGGRALTFHQPHGASPAGQTSAARTHAHRGC